MNVFIVIGKDSYTGEAVTSVSTTLDKAVSKASGAIRIEEFSLDTENFVGMYTTEGKRAALYNNGLMEI